ncbi:MAG TPA: c-type cytochrome [Alphaproteobacteria bacterium]|jgi:mono/diheme cytochrome c family protein|nr:c-type cytochrome [Alphaproteobacteria bacterium]
MTQTIIRIVFGLGFSTVISLAAIPAHATQDEVIAAGKEEYQENCTACHGDAGKGDGRLAEILIIKPTDLTQISKRNNGTFPFWQIYGVVEGTVPVKGHVYMPNWRSRFKADEPKPGYEYAYMRILLLTHYLESIQEK